MVELMKNDVPTGGSIKISIIDANAEEDSYKLEELIKTILK